MRGPNAHGHGTSMPDSRLPEASLSRSVACRRVQRMVAERMLFTDDKKVDEGQV
jgi:hypothetical protein